MWIRKCQECSNYQEDKPNSLTNSYKNRICRRCKSPALDFGFEIKDIGMCPVCGENVTVKLEGGKLIGKCGDWFTVKRWKEDDDDEA